MTNFEIGDIAEHHSIMRKWTNEKVDVGVLGKLQERSQLFHYQNVHLSLFAKNGFTKGCMDKAQAMGNVTLVTYADILKVL